MIRNGKWYINGTNTLTNMIAWSIPASCSEEYSIESIDWADSESELET